MSKAFKAGDRVYYPALDSKIHVLVDMQCLHNPFGIHNPTGTTHFTELGKYYKEDSTPQIFHATEANKAALFNLYGVEFEDPTTRLLGSALTRYLLNSGRDSVMCVVSDTSDAHCTLKVSRLTRIRLCTDTYFYSETGYSWRHAVPVAVVNTSLEFIHDSI